jgi:DTW domain-containing protein YfiP
MRVMCYRCFWPEKLCWCASLRPMGTQTRFVFLMHPKEFKEEKAGTGRLTHLCLPNSEIHMGTAFDGDEAIQALINDPKNYPVLLYPGKEALNLSEAGGGEQGAGNPQLSTLNTQLEQRTLLVFLLDATWSGARKMLRLSPSLQRLPRIMFTPSAPSRYIIKQQPVEGCLSTLEAVHELLGVLERTGLDRYEDPAQLLGLFQRMQDFQISCAADPNRGGYRRQAYSAPAERVAARGRSGARRLNFLQGPQKNGETGSDAVGAVAPNDPSEGG